ncbi:Ribonuclease T2 precursor (RNase T2) [Vermiconidia calcicola]|uniref:Ribonuclease T2-like n=1 Tax=Vermiconidia calcicola TaxID=1690605 RepID=A0AAV9Q124_9PEZI|nr:Ribonuclease T2 precursor (RNase T2) [Vermiconidia calcicola]
MLDSLYKLPLFSSLLNLSPLFTPPPDTRTIIPVSQYQSQSSCPNPPSISCPFPPPREINTCCLNHPSGHFLQTQFWDSSPALGPNTSWTIHGLWPDLCAGGFDSFCDTSRSHSPSDMRTLLTSLLNSTHTTQHDLLDFMDTYWLSLDDQPQHLWAHEWNKHGTCISTLDPDCYAPSQEDPDLSVLDYFVHTTSLFRTLDTYTLLAEAGILPSRHQRYTLRELEDAIESSPHGYPVTFRCTHAGELNEIWYHFSVMGSLRNSYPRQEHENETHNQSPSSPLLDTSTVREIFIPTDPDGAKSNCPSQGIKYLPKDKNPDGHRPGPSPSHTTSTATSTSIPTSAPFTGKGHLAIHILDDTSSSPPNEPPQTQNILSLSDELPSTQRGCLIRLGQWYVSGTCATFKAQPDIVDPGHARLFSLSSSYSPCVFSGRTGKLECTKSTTVQSIFSSDHENPHVLSYQNRTTFYADHVPRRFDKVDIYADDGDGERSVQLEIHWVAV